MSEQGTSYQPASGGPGVPPPPPPPPSQGTAFGTGQGNPGGTPAPAAAKGWRPSKKLVIIASSIILVVVIGLVGLFIVKDIMRGGEKSPEAAGEKLIESVNNKDVVGLVTNISPHERDAVMRLQSAVTDKFKEFGIAEALKKVSPEAAEATNGGEFSLDGVEITVSGATPTVTELSEGFAQVRFSSGEVRTVIDPGKTKGALRAALDAADQDEVIENEFLVADLGPNQNGLSLISAKTDGRWYLSPMLSALEYGNTWVEEDKGASSRGQLPDKFPAGSDSPDAAASAAVGSTIAALNSADPSKVAPSLVKHEAAAIYLYANLWQASGADKNGFKVKLGDSSFTKGPQDGNRALAFVQNLSLSADGDKVSLTDTCVSDPSGEKMCLNGSGYAMGYGTPSANPMSMFTVDGKFGLTTVKEDGKWKVSVLDTATDMAISWMNSITKEQALALLRVERADAPSGGLTLGKTDDIAFNSAGYAVRTLEVDKAQNVTLDGGDADISTTVYKSDLTTEVDSKSASEDRYFELEPGSYTVVLHARNGWQEKFETEGNKIKFSVPVEASSYVAAPKIDGYEGRYEGSLSSSNDGKQTLELVVPKGITQKLVMSGVKSNAYTDYVVEVNGRRQVIPVGEDAEHIIDLPADAESVTLTVEVGKQTDNNVAKPLAHSSVHAWFDLEFENK